MTIVTSRAERREDVRELGGDEAAAEDHRSARGSSAMRMMVSLVCTPHPASPRGRRDIVGPAPAAITTWSAVITRRRSSVRSGRRCVDEAGVRLVDRRRSARSRRYSSPAGRDRVDPAEDPVARSRSSAPRRCGRRRRARGPSRARPGQVGGVDEHLGGDAADVQAGAAERALLARSRSSSPRSVGRRSSCPSRCR